MKKIFKYSLLLLAAGLVFTACKDDDSAGKLDPVVLSGPQTYFNTEAAKTIELSKENSSFAVTIYRQDTKGEVTVPITVTMPEGSIYTAPSSVTFADGASTADIVITYDPANLQFGDYTEFTISVQDENLTTPYGPSTYTFSAGITEFEDWDIALYREGLVGDWGFGVENLIYEVPIQRSLIREGVYRLVNPYGKPYPYNAPADYDASTDSYMVIDASDPEYVWVDGFETTMDWGYGVFSFPSYVYYLYRIQGNDLATLKAANPELFGTLENGIITMPANSFLGSMANYQGGKIYGGFNTAGLFGVALPGYRFADYSADFELRGSLTKPDGTSYIVGTATLGDDVTAALAGLATAETLDAVYAELVAGNGVEVISGEEFELPFEASGKYYVIIVTFDEAGEAQDYAVATVQAVNPNDQKPEIVWTAEFVGDYTYGLFKEDNVDQGLTIYSDGSDESHFKIEPWGVGKSLELYLGEGGVITVPEDQPTGITGAKGELLCTDYVTYTGDDKYVSTFANNVFTIYMIYYNDEGEQYLVKDTFVLTGEAETKHAVKLSSKRMDQATRIQKFDKKLSKLNTKHMPI